MAKKYDMYTFASKKPKVEEVLILREELSGKYDELRSKQPQNPVHSPIAWPCTSSEGPEEHEPVCSAAIRRSSRQEN